MFSVSYREIIGIQLTQNYKLYNNTVVYNEFINMMMHGASYRNKK